MKIKNIILLMVVLFITGCTVDYDLTFDENSVEEKINIILETTDEKENAIHMDNEEYYAIIEKDKALPYKKIKDESGNYNFTYNYSLSDFKKSRFTNCYDAYSLINEQGYVTFSTTKEFKCLVYDYMTIDNVNINIKTDYKVVENNADEIRDNTYIWHINSENSDNKPILFKYNTKQKRKLSFQEWLKNNMQNIIIIAIIFSVFILVSISIFIKHKKVNKI